MVTCDQQEKVSSSQNVLEKKYLIWMYAELNRLLVGSSLNPLNIELEHDDRTVCCNHKIVDIQFYEDIASMLKKLYHKKAEPQTKLPCQICRPHSVFLSAYIILHLREPMVHSCFGTK